MVNEKHENTETDNDGPDWDLGLLAPLPDELSPNVLVPLARELIALCKTLDVEVVAGIVRDNGVFDDIEYADANTRAEEFCDSFVRAISGSP
ncbi:MAG: hypothetical protein AAF715_26585 [Myxococcota bacterium]